MSTKPFRRGLVAAAVALLGWSALKTATGGADAKEPPPDPAPAEGGAGPKPYYFASRQGCGRAGCHASPPTPEDTYLCRCDEYTRWVESDRHAQAARVLSGELGGLMARRLGYDVTTAEACLRCHGAVVKDPEARDKNFSAEAEGVGCCVCHGAYRDWYEPHGSYLQADRWRKLTRAEKERRYGMTDVWDPARRTALCASCHIGDIDGGKFITHEMYEAGHPRLPGFEAAAFCEAMPRHWRLAREKPAAIRALAADEGGECEQTRLALVGAAVSLRESMRLLARQSAACLKSDDPDGRALDYASLECSACHHDLRPPGRGPGRDAPGAAGRGPGYARRWPAALIGPALRHAYGDKAPREAEAFRGLWEKVEAGLRARPDGDPARAGPAAEALARWADELAGAVSRCPIDRADGERALAGLLRLPEDEAPDYDSARQIAWAVAIVYREQGQQGRPAKDAGAEPSPVSLAGQLRLTLPPGGPGRTSADLGEALQARGAYDPGRFRRSLAALAERLAQKGPGGARPILLGVRDP
jgi:hypothetical protein